MVWRKAWGSTWMAEYTAQVDTPRGRTRVWPQQHRQALVDLRVPEPLGGVECCSEQVVQGLRAEIQEDAVMPQHSSPGLRFPGTGEASAPFLGPRLSGLICKCWGFLWPLPPPSGLS